MRLGAALSLLLALGRARNMEFQTLVYTKTWKSTSSVQEFVPDCQDWQTNIFSFLYFPYIARDVNVDVFRRYLGNSTWEKILNIPPGATGYQRAFRGDDICFKYQLKGNSGSVLASSFVMKQGLCPGGIFVSSETQPVLTTATPGSGRTSPTMPDFTTTPACFLLANKGHTMTIHFENIQSDDYLHWTMGGNVDLLNNGYTFPVTADAWLDFATQNELSPLFRFFAGSSTSTRSITWNITKTNPGEDLTFDCGDQSYEGDVEHIVVPPATPSASPLATPTKSPTPTRSPVATPTKSPTQSRSPTPTRSPVATPTKSPTQSRSPTPTPTRSPTQTRSPTPTPTRSPTQTRSPMATPEGTAMATETETPSPTASRSPKATQSSVPSLSTATPAETAGQSTYESATTRMPTESRSPSPTLSFPPPDPTESPFEGPTPSQSKRQSLLGLENPDVVFTLESFGPEQVKTLAVTGTLGFLLMGFCVVAMVLYMKRHLRNLRDPPELSFEFDGTETFSDSYSDPGYFYHSGDYYTEDLDPSLDDEDTVAHEYSYTYDYDDEDSYYYYASSARFTLSDSHSTMKIIGRSNGAAPRKKLNFDI